MEEIPIFPVDTHHVTRPVWMGGKTLSLLPPSVPRLSTVLPQPPGTHAIAASTGHTPTPKRAAPNCHRPRMQPALRGFFLVLFAGFIATITFQLQTRAPVAGPQ